MVAAGAVVFLARGVFTFSAAGLEAAVFASFVLGEAAFTGADLLGAFLLDLVFAVLREAVFLATALDVATLAAAARAVGALGAVFADVPAAAFLAAGGTGRS